jgi:hypothetical protein
MAAMHSRSRQPTIRTLGTMRSSWVFYGRTTVRQLKGDRGMAAVAFVADDPDHFLIATEDEYQRIQERLPANVVVIDRVPYFLEDEQLVLLGHAEKTDIAKRKEDLRR